jgi:4-amino-4-deoxy-L-arabinose transferase-like glycosyltransferase
VVLLLWQFTTIWNDFLIGVVVLGNPNLAPVNVAVQNLSGSYTVEWNVRMAGALIAALATILVYLLLGKLFMRGLLTGALKGCVSAGAVEVDRVGERAHCAAVAQLGAHVEAAVDRQPHAH